MFVNVCIIFIFEGREKLFTVKKNSVGLHSLLLYYTRVCLLLFVKIWFLLAACLPACWVTVT